MTTLNARWNWVRVRNIVKRLLVPYRLCAIVRVYDKSPKGLLILRGRTEGRDMEFKSRLLRRMTQERISALSGVRQVVGLMSVIPPARDESEDTRAVFTEPIMLHAVMVDGRTMGPKSEERPASKPIKVIFTIWVSASLLVKRNSGIALFWLPHWRSPNTFFMAPVSSLLR